MIIASGRRCLKPVRSLSSMLIVPSPSSTPGPDALVAIDGFNRLVMASEADPVAVVVAAYHHAAEGGRIGSCLPGPNPALPELLGAGCRIIDRDTFMSSDSELFDPTRRISDGGIQ